MSYSEHANTTVTRMDCRDYGRKSTFFSRFSFPLTDGRLDESIPSHV